MCSLSAPLGPRSGGMELIFGGMKQVEAEVQFTGQKATVAELLTWMRDNMVKERPELFMRGNTV